MGRVKLKTFLSTQFQDSITKYYNILEYERHCPRDRDLGQQADEILQDLVKDENLELVRIIRHQTLWKISKTAL